MTNYTSTLCDLYVYIDAATSRAAFGSYEDSKAALELALKTIGNIINSDRENRYVSAREEER